MNYQLTVMGLSGKIATILKTVGVEPGDTGIFMIVQPELEVSQ